jgi:predicted lipoprotein with Yx(FWY)xxD motif
LLAALLAGTLAVPAPAGAHAVRAKLVLRHTQLGTILARGDGFTVYVFTHDQRNKDMCQNIPGCTNVWPALTSSGRALAGRGVRSGLIGTIRLKDGAKQVTYAGHPLYTYIGDGGPRQTSYVNFFEFGGHWLALNRSGREVR